MKDLAEARLFNPDPSKPLAMLKACPVYEATPLTRHDGLWVKDETARMGLGAFKALGGVYAVAQILSEAAGVSAEALFGQKSDTCFVTASAGNHGIAVAAGAALFGARARIHLADTVPESFADRLRAKGAEVARSGADYEASIVAAIADAEASGAVHLADGSWEGYLSRPALIMEGYCVIAEEMRAEFEALGEWPSVVYLQAGVGGLAGAMAHMIRANWKVQPEIVVVEPEAAPCLKESVAAGEMLDVAGPVSNMGRLDCKRPSLLAFDTLRRDADRFEIVSDAAAEAAIWKAARLGFATTPSGAAGFAAHLAAPQEGALVILSETCD